MRRTCYKIRASAIWVPSSGLWEMLPSSWNFSEVRQQTFSFRNRSNTIVSQNKGEVRSAFLIYFFLVFGESLVSLWTVIFLLLLSFVRLFGLVFPLHA